MVDLLISYLINKLVKRLIWSASLLVGPPVDQLVDQYVGQEIDRLTESLVCCLVSSVCLFVSDDEHHPAQSQGVQHATPVPVCTLPGSHTAAHRAIPGQVAHKTKRVCVPV